MSNRLNCPSMADLRSLALFSNMMGITAIFCLRVPGRVSSAPDLIKFSSVRLLTSLWVMRPTKSSMDRKGPPASRSAMMVSTTDLPTLLMAERP